MTAKKRVSRRSLGSDLKKVDAHQIKPAEYREAPELTDEMLARAVVKRAGRPVASDPRLLVSVRLPASTIARWKASGPGWQTRMAKVIERARTK
jgi:uncharacterized protein (DUF4415 family)